MNERISIKKIIENTESQSLLRSSVIIFIWIFLRNVLEGVLESSQQLCFSNISYKYILMFFIHFPLFYIGLFCILVISISLITRVNIEKVTGISSCGLGLIVLIPLIDAFWGGFTLTYPLRLGPYILNFFNPVKDISHIGVSPGQRIIVTLINILIAIYVYVKTRSIPKSIIAVLLSTVLILLWGGMTTIIANNRPEYYYVSGGLLFSDTQKFAAIYSLLFLPIYFIYWYLYDRKNLYIILRSMRLKRMFLFGGMGIFGYILAKHQSAAVYSNPFNLLVIAMVFLLLAFAFWAVQIVNDFYDVEIDRLTRNRNPLIHSDIKRVYLIWCALISFIVLTFAIITGYPAFILVSMFLALGYIYSVPPIRLKRIPLLSTFIHALAMIIAIGVGYSLYFGNRALHSIPGYLLIPTLISVTLGFSAKDIHDRVGDSANQIYTLAVFFYSEDNVLHRLPLSLIIASSYLVYAIFIPQLLAGAILFSILTLVITLFLNKPREWIYFALLYVFGFYLLYTFIH